MNFKKPNFWNLNKPNFFSYFLLPLSLIIQLLKYFKYIITPKFKSTKIRTICVGNIYLGGTGKTMLSIKINEFLKKKKIKTCFIKKDYSNQIDEQQILQNNGPLIKDNKRINCLKKAIDEKYEIAIFDDGLQDPSINYDLKFVCFNNINWIGNGLTIPSGPLRESVKNLKKYKNIFLNGNMENLEIIKNQICKINPNINLYMGRYIPTNIKDFDLKKNYLVFSGIGNHQTFINMLKICNFNVIKDIEFSDHYNYSINDLKEIISLSKKLNCKIITTEKDYTKINKYNLKEIEVITSKLEIENEKDLFNTILRLYE